MNGHTTSDSELLPEDLLWADGGHASDVVLTALADGQQGIVPNGVRLHVERCPVCTSHLGHAALLSLHSERELAARAEHDLVLAKPPLPRLAIALGLAVAVLGLVPSILDSDGEGATIRTFVVHDVPLFMRGLGTLAHRLDEPGSPAGLFLTYVAAALLVCMGIAAVRLLPKKETPR
jgi:hypothetical protein